MKRFLIRYHLENGSPEEWHAEVARFIAALDNDAAVKGRISYRVMKTANGDYFHLASAADEAAIVALEGSEFFQRYTDRTDQVAGGDVVVQPLEIIAETEYRL